MPMFSSELYSFKLLHLNVWSILNKFYAWCERFGSFFWMWLASSPSIICWKDYFFPSPNGDTWHTSQKSANHMVSFQILYSVSSIQMSIYIPGPHCLSYCSFAVSLKIRVRESFNFRFLFQDYFGSSGYLEFPYESSSQVLMAMCLFSASSLHESCSS